VGGAGSGRRSGEAEGVEDAEDCEEKLVARGSRGFPAREEVERVLLEGGPRGGGGETKRPPLAPI